MSGEIPDVFSSVEEYTWWDLKQTTVTERWCPKCQPERDPLKELLEEVLCSLHMPSDDGSQDARVTAKPQYSTDPGF